MEDWEFLERPDEESCTCHMGHPPCSFCLGLDEREADIFHEHGSEGVRRFRMAKEDHPGAEIVETKVFGKVAFMTLERSLEMDGVGEWA